LTFTKRRAATDGEADGKLLQIAAADLHRL
jgi:hypothetical protein